jgi:hypothetical protein
MWLCTGRGLHQIALQSVTLSSLADRLSKKYLRAKKGVLVSYVVEDFLVSRRRKIRQI